MKLQRGEQGQRGMNSLQDSKLSRAYGYPGVKLSGQRPQVMSFWAENLISTLAVASPTLESTGTGWERSSAAWQSACLAFMKPWVWSLAQRGPAVCCTLVTLARGRQKQEPQKFEVIISSTASLRPAAAVVNAKCFTALRGL